MTTPTTVQVQIQLRADTAANWTAQNPTLLAAELGLETDTKKIKIGDGTTAWNSLAYFPFVVSGGTVLGNLEIGSTGTLTFEGSTANGFETTLGVVDPTADRTINLPNQSGTVIVSGNASIVDADISASAEIAVSKLADGAARQLLQTDAAGTGVEWTSNVDVPGTLDVTGAATFDSSVTITGDLTVNGTTTNINTQNLVVEDKNIILADVATPTDTTADGGGITLKGATDKTITWSNTTGAWTSNQVVDLPAGIAATPSLIFGADTNTGIYSPGADQVAISTNGTGRLFVDASGNAGLGTSTPATLLHVDGGTITCQRYGLSGALIIRSAGGTQSSPTAIASSTSLSNLVSRGYDGSTYRDAASIQVFSDGAVSSTSSPGALTFGTTPSGSTTTQERLRITSDGKLGLGTSAPSAKLYVSDTSTQAPSLTYGAAASTTLLSADVELAFGLSGTTPFTYWLQTRDSTNAARTLAINPLGGNVGIGTTDPQYLLDVRSSGTQSIRVGTTDTSGIAIGQFYATYQGGGGGVPSSVYLRAGDGYTFVSSGHNVPLLFGINDSEKARIDSSGRLLVGYSSAITTTNALTAKLQSAGNSVFDTGISTSLFTADTNPAALQLVKSRNATTGSHTVVQSGDGLGRIAFGGSDGADFKPAAWIEGQVDGTPGANTMPGRLVFSTTSTTPGASPTERMRITSGGYFKASNSGGYLNSAGLYHEIAQTNNEVGLWLQGANASYSNTVLASYCSRAASSAYSFYTAWSNGISDAEFNLRGDGNGYCDGSWTGGGADYAEYFEWSDSNPDAEDRRGISVVLDGDKIRPAVAGEDPIGVISGNPSVVGDAAWNKWSGKYLRDEFGTYILEDYEVTDDDGNTVTQQRRKLNPAFDPDVEYTSREERPEWDCVGLMGKLRIRKGQPTGSRWIKMRDISDSVEEWLVR